MNQSEQESDSPPQVLADNLTNEDTSQSRDPQQLGDREPLSVSVNQQQSVEIIVGSISLLLLLVLCGTGFWYWNGRTHTGPTPAPSPGPEPKPKPTGEALFVFGGDGGRSVGKLSSVYRLNVTEMDNPGNGWKSCSPLSRARRDARAMVYDGNIYLTGGLGVILSEYGDETEVVLDNFERYSPEADSWYHMPEMINPRTQHCAVLFNSQATNQTTLYVIAGMHQVDGEPAPFGSVDMIQLSNRSDMAVKSWVERNSTPVALYGHECVAHDQFIFVFGGADDWGNEIHGFKFDPAANLWSTLSPSCRLGNRYYGLVSMPITTQTSARDVLFALGGIGPVSASSTYLRSIQNVTLCKDDCCDSWTTTSTRLADGRYHFAVAPVMSRGSIIIAGGILYSGSLEVTYNEMEEFKAEQKLEDGSTAPRLRRLSLALPLRMSRFALQAFTFH